MATCLRDIPDFLNQIKMQLGFVAVTGFEPMLPDPESDVLPLHHTAMKSPHDDSHGLKYQSYWFNLDIYIIFNSSTSATIVSVLI